MTAFNLLHYPDLASQRKSWHRRWTASVGVAVGVAVAWWSIGWALEASHQVSHERSALQQQLTQHQQQQKKHQKMQAQQKKWFAESAHLTHLEQQHRTWLALYQALQKESGPDSVQLLRLQLESNILEMQGKARHARGMDRAHQALTASLAQHLDPVLLVSSWLVKPTTGRATTVSGQAGVELTTQADSLGDGLEFVWQSGWPDGSATAQFKGAAQAGQSTEQEQP